MIAKGISIEKAEIIKNCEYDKVSEQEARALAPNLALNIARGARSGNSANYSIYWHWDQRPALLFTDYIATSISDNYWVTGQSTAKLTYRSSNGSAYSVKRIAPSKTNGGTCSFAIPMSNNNGSPVVNYCQAGKAFVGTVGNNSPNWALLANASYFHSAVPDGITVTLGVNYYVISGSVSGSGRIEKMHQSISISRTHCSTFMGVFHIFH